MIKPSCNRVNEQTWFLNIVQCSVETKVTERAMHSGSEAFQARPEVLRRKRRVNYILVTVLHQQSLPQQFSRALGNILPGL